MEGTCECSKFCMRFSHLSLLKHNKQLLPKENSVTEMLAVNCTPVCIITWMETCNCFARDPFGKDKCLVLCPLIFSPFSFPSLFFPFYFSPFILCSSPFSITTYSSVPSSLHLSICTASVKMPREFVKSPSLETFKTYLYAFLSGLI